MTVAAVDCILLQRQVMSGTWYCGITSSDIMYCFTVGLIVSELMKCLKQDVGWNPASEPITGQQPVSHNGCL